MQTTFIGLDIETTGFDPRTEEIIEIALIKFTYNDIFQKELIDIKSYQSLVNPQKKIPQIVVNLTNIEDEHVKDAPLLSDIKKEILECIGDNPIFGHNISFDVEFLIKKGFTELQNNLLLDTMDIVSIAFPEEPSYSLETLSTKLNLTHINKHRAYDDVLGTFFLLKEIKNSFELLKPQTITSMQQFLQNKDWPWSKFFSYLKPSDAIKKTQKNIEKKGEAASNEKIFKLLDSFIKKNTKVIAECENYHVEEIYKFLAKKKDKIIIASKNLPQINDENVHIIYPQEYYICPDRFQKFIEKNCLSFPEITFALKCMIQLNENPEFLKHDLALLSDEKKYWQEVASEELFCKNCQHFPFSTTHDHNKVVSATSHFQFFKETIKNPEQFLDHKIIITDLENFKESASYSLNQKFKLNNFDYLIKHLKKDLSLDQEFINNVQNKIEIIFGLIGIIHEKFQKLSDYNPNELNIDKTIKNSLEWQNLFKSAINLKEYLKEKNYFQFEYKKLIEIADNFHQQLEEENKNLQIIITNNKEIILESKVKDLSFYLQNNFWPKLNNYFLLSPNIYYKNESDSGFSYIKTELGLLGETPTEIFLPFDTEQKLPFILKKSEEEAINEIIKENKNTFIITSSVTSVKNIFGQLSENLNKNEALLLAQKQTGGNNKIIQSFLNADKPTIIIGNYDLFSFCVEQIMPFIKTKNIPILIIHKLLFDSPQNINFIQNSTKYRNSFLEYSLPRTGLTLKKSIDLFFKNKGEKIYGLDPKFFKDYSAKILKNLQGYVERRDQESE